MYKNSIEFKQYFLNNETMQAKNRKNQLRVQSKWSGKKLRATLKPTIISILDGYKEGIFSSESLNMQQCWFYFPV